MLNIIEKGIRGGLCSFSSQYYAEVEDQNKESIAYIDANNLYGFIMLQKLPVEGFEWINVESKDTQEILKTPCILEVDIEYPKELFEDHKDNRLVPKKYMLSKNQEIVPKVI
jgi:hypothetical protein